MCKFVLDEIVNQFTNTDIIITLKPKSKTPEITYVATERREIVTTDVTYRMVDTKLLKKYFPSIYESIVEERKLVKRKGGKE